MARKPRTIDDVLKSPRNARERALIAKSRRLEKEVVPQALLRSIAELESASHEQMRRGNLRLQREIDSEADRLGMPRGDDAALILAEVADWVGKKPDDHRGVLLALIIKRRRLGKKPFKTLFRKRGRPAPPLPPGTKQRHAELLSEFKKPSNADRIAAKGDKKVADRLRKRRDQRRRKNM